MALDAAVNFAKAALAAGYDAAATSIAVAAGQGARFGPVPFNASWWNFTDAADPADDPTVEIIRVTAIVGDTLTVTRAQEATTAATHNTAGKVYKLMAGPTAKLVSDLNATFITASGGVAGRVAFWASSTAQGSAGVFVWDNTNKRLGVGTGTPTAPLNVGPAIMAAPPSGTAIHVGVADGVATQILLDSISAIPIFAGRRANGTTATKTGVVLDDVLLRVAAAGYNSAGAFGTASGELRICAAETHTASTAATYVVVYTTPPGSLTPVERLRVSETGDMFVQGGVAAAGTLAGTTIYSQLGTGTALSVPGVTIQTGSTATGNTAHSASPYLNWYGSIWSGSAAVAKGMFLGVVGVSGTNSAYVLQLYSSDLAPIMEIRGDTGNVLFNAPTFTVNGTVTIKAGSGGGVKFADGTTQTTAAVGGGGTVTGTGTATQLAFWSSTTAIAADGGLAWDNTNKTLLIGNPLAAAPTSGAGLEVSGADGVVGRIELTSYGAANAFTGRRVNGTAASRTAVAANDVLAQFTGIGYTSAAAFSSVSADVRLVAAEAYTSAAQGAYIVFRTALIGTTSPVEKMRLTDAGNLGVGTTPAERLHTFGASNVYNLIESSAATGVAVATAYKTGNRRWEIGQAPGIGDNGFTIYDATAPAVRFKIDTAGAVTIGGNVTAPNFLGLASSAAYALQVPQHVQASAYTLAAVDRGCHVAAGAGITVPASVFGAGDIVTIYNNTAGAITITQGASVTMYLCGTATTGNRTLAQRGMANVLCVGSNTFVCSGGGVT
jgi:hypothetical protein